VAKVKKRVGLTGVRNVKAGKVKRPIAGKGSARTSKQIVGKRKSVAKPLVRASVRELDPQRKCGAGTSVQFLYRVDETVDGRTTTHLVFFDRHGWYCEHGRTCPAVTHAKKHNGQLARVS
jgi:hypothetical protein